MATCGNGVLAPIEERLQAPILQVWRLGGLDPGGLEAWRLGGLEAGWLAGLDWIGVLARWEVLVGLDD